MMTRIYSAAAAAVDDHRRLFVRLSIPNSDRYDYDQYLCEISPETFSKYKGNMYFSSIDSDCLGGCCGGLLYLYHGNGKTVILNPIKREFKFLPPSQVKRPAAMTTSVISFDFENGSFSSFIPLPKTLRTLYNFKGSDDDPDIFDALDVFEFKGSLAVIGYKKLGGSTSFEAYKLKEQGQEWEKEFAVKVSGDHEPLGFGKKGRLLFLVGTFVQNKRYQLQVYDRFDQNLVAFPIFADGVSRMQILPCSDDDPDANIFSRVKSIVVPPDAKQFFVDERMEIDNPINHHLYRNLGSKSMASKQQVSAGSTEQGQGLNKRIAAVWNFRMTKEETCTTALKELTARGCKLDNSCKAGYVSTLEDGLKEKDPGTDLKGNPDIISISTWKRICYFQSQWLSESEVEFKLVGDFKTQNDRYGKLLTGGGDHVNCVSQEEQHPIPPKNKGGSLAVIGYKKLGGSTSFEAYKLKEQGQEWEKEFAVKVSGDHEPLGFGKKGRLLFLVGTFVQNKRYQLQVYDRFDQNLVAPPIFVDGVSRMQILPCSDDDPDANIFSRVKSIVVPPDAKQFFVDERMEIDNPINHHLYRNLGSKSIASKQQVSAGSTEQGQGLNKRRAAVWNFRTTKEETCTTALKELTARGCKLDNSCKAGYVSTLEDGLKKKDPGTDLKGNPDIISISTWKQICYFQSQWLSESEVEFKLVGDFKTKNDMYGKLVTGGGDHVNCVSQEEQHPIRPKNKGKKRKSNDGVEQLD
ncbi:hypothetical protein OROMI_027220 [Orobanche minor]